eukprot:GHVT01064039.1.p1 GENE.GHVT01064039.1~~GHVT01064039.1.p1  ORF type:complete len:342 (+),score=44.24 GHVT01064039.1:216-1241(+)
MKSVGRGTALNHSRAFKPASDVSHPLSASFGSGIAAKKQPTSTAVSALADLDLILPALQLGVDDNEESSLSSSAGSHPVALTPSPFPLLATSPASPPAPPAPNMPSLSLGLSESELYLTLPHTPPEDARSGQKPQQHFNTQAPPGVCRLLPLERNAKRFKTLQVPLPPRVTDKLLAIGSPVGSSSQFPITGTMSSSNAAGIGVGGAPGSSGCLFAPPLCERAIDSAIVRMNRAGKLSRWFDLPEQPATPENLQQLQALRLRGFVLPGQFFKREGTGGRVARQQGGKNQRKDTGLPTHYHVARVIEGGLVPTGAGKESQAAGTTNRRSAVVTTTRITIASPR